MNSGWNLNNLPVLEQSVLCHINADISGMKVSPNVHRYTCICLQIVKIFLNWTVDSFFTLVLNSEIHCLASNHEFIKSRTPDLFKSCI